MLTDSQYNQIAAEAFSARAQKRRAKVDAHVLLALLHDYRALYQGHLHAASGIGNVLTVTEQARPLMRDSNDDPQRRDR